MFNICTTTSSLFSWSSSKTYVWRCSLVKRFRVDNKPISLNVFGVEIWIEKIIRRSLERKLKIEKLKSKAHLRYYIYVCVCVSCLWICVCVSCQYDLICVLYFFLFIHGLRFAVASHGQQGQRTLLRSWCRHVTSSWSSCLSWLGLSNTSGQLAWVSLSFMRTRTLLTTSLPWPGSVCCIGWEGREGRCVCVCVCGSISLALHTYILVHICLRVCLCLSLGGAKHVIIFKESCLQSGKVRVSNFGHTGRVLFLKLITFFVEFLTSTYNVISHEWFRSSHLEKRHRW